MKRLLTKLPLLLLVVGEANAMEKHDTMNMTCAEVQAALQSGGKAHLRFPSKVDGMMRYGNFVAGRQMCKMQQIAMWTKVPASDTKSCVVVQCSQYGRSISKY
jgi:hypothetical protein